MASAGSQSLCQPYFEVITGKLELGLTAQRIFQDIKSENGFSGGYSSVKRFVRRLGNETPLPFRRMECEPGEEAQVDFGTGAWIINQDGRRRSHVFRIVLSHSRKGYSEAVFKQNAESFIRCLENAFRAWGGVPKTLVPDNLKAAVIKADWYDPDLNPKLEEFGRHYGIVILPAKPRTPRHKGKVENGVKYVQDNGLKGKIFTSLALENEHLRNWERQIADTRIHGTTRKQVGKLFEEAEKAALQPLHAEAFPFFEEGKRTVHRDGHIEMAKAYYSVPPEYLGREVWVRWDSRLVRVFNKKSEQIAVHSRALPGKFATDAVHISSRKISGVERGAEHLVNKAGKSALELGCLRLKPVRELCGRREEKEIVEFQETHAVIRPMAEYQQHLFNERSFNEPSTDALPQTTEAVGPDCHAGRAIAGGDELKPQPPGVLGASGQ
jgi:transposase